MRLIEECATWVAALDVGRDMARARILASFY
jgi:hypothetical protein